jgi:hypothetical protein
MILEEQLNNYVELKQEESENFCIPATKKSCYIF